MMLAERLAKPVSTRIREWIETRRSVAARSPRRYENLEDDLCPMSEENHHLSEEQARHLTIHGVSQN